MAAVTHESAEEREEALTLSAEKSQFPREQTAETTICGSCGGSGPRGPSSDEGDSFEESEPETEKPSSSPCARSVSPSASGATCDAAEPLLGAPAADLGEDATAAFDEGKVPMPDPPTGWLAALALRFVQWAIYCSCIALTWTILSVRAFLACFFRGRVPEPVLHRPDARLSWEALSTANDPCEAARAALPTPPPFPMPPADGPRMVVSFGPCANLMIYTGGVAACLQSCPNYKEVAPRLRFYGGSCGAFVAASVAADRDMMSMLPEMIAWTKKFQGRLWGLIGAYAESIAAIAWDIFSDPSRFELARERLCMAVTAFQPGPTRVAVDEFASASDLVTTLLGSCYIPVAFERPQWHDRLGPLWDGGILEFATQGDVVVSPFDSDHPDIFHGTAYPRSFVFFPPCESDAVKIFEDGYMDCLRWLQAGAPSKRVARAEAKAAEAASGGGVLAGLRPLLREAKRFISEILQESSYDSKAKASEESEPERDVSGSGGD